MNTFDAKITALQKRFPAANYGWKNEIVRANIRGTQKGLKFTTPEVDSHDCKTTARIAGQELSVSGGTPTIVSLKLQHDVSRAFANHFFTTLTFADDVCVIGLTPYDQVLGFYPYTIFPREDFQQMMRKARMYAFPPENIEGQREVSIGGNIPLEVALSGVNKNLLYASSLSIRSNFVYSSLVLRVAAYLFDPVNFCFKNPITILIAKNEYGITKEEHGRFPQAESRRILKGLEERGHPALEWVYEQSWLNSTL